MKSERKNDEGFTLIEMMAVLVIMGLLIGAAVVATAPMRTRGLQTRVNSDLATITQALELFNSDMFDYPPEEFGLPALQDLPGTIDGAERYNGPYLTKLPDDPWGRPYVYVYPGDTHPYELLSYGRDGEPGGEGPDADISFWDDEA